LNTPILIPAYHAQLPKDHPDDTKVPVVNNEDQLAVLISFPTMSGWIVWFARRDLPVEYQQLDQFARQFGAFRLSRRKALAASGAAVVAAAINVSAQEATPDASPAASPVASNPVTSSVPQVFGYDAFQFEFLILLGGTFEQAADIGECFAGASQITDGDFNSWCETWIATGTRLKSIADACDKAGHAVSAREAYLRASNYLGEAVFFADGSKDPSQLIPTWELHRACFDAFAARLPVPAEQVTIPYEDTTLPGYVLKVDDSGAKRPWIILNNGSDGTATDMWVQSGAAALRRGYNVLIFDGPGQGAALYRQNLYFRYDWEKVITPVVDYLLTRTDVDPARIALQGVSQAGYWVPRAVAFEHRIAAAVADPGVMNVVDSWTGAFPPGALDGLYNATGAELDEIKAEIDKGVAEATSQTPDLGPTLAFRMRPYGTTSYSETVLLAKDYTLDGITDQITCPMLITDPEGESFWPGQSQQLYDALKSPKTMANFTAADGADLHCEPKANGLRSQVIFDWLDETLGGSGS
jgi:hypothetical protein